MVLHRSIRALVVSLVSCLSANGLAHAAASGWVGDQRAAVRLITATDSLSTNPAFDAGIEFRFGAGWHGYWRTPGDAGIAPQFDWSGSEKDRKSTRLNSSHRCISYAVFCLKK